MGQLLVRDVSDEAIAELKKRAKANGRSTEAEHRALLQGLVKSSEADFWKEADRLRKELEDSGRVFSDSAELIRQDRDSR